MQFQDKRIAILGGSGMLGADLVKYLSKAKEVVSITRENYEDIKNSGAEYDVLINANGNSKRFWANQNPVEDFDKSTRSVYLSLFDFKAKLYIYCFFSGTSMKIHPVQIQPTKIKYLLLEKLHHMGLIRGSLKLSYKNMLKNISF